jgi:hypothetical protein
VKTLPEREPKHTRDLFAELYVAGVLADADWHIYFPKRDFGFDFIATKKVGDEILVRPVQVKGKYPTADKGDKAYYGYMGRLSQLHPEMVLVIPFFTSERSPSPKFIAFMPRGQLRHVNKGPDWFKVMPCRFESGCPQQRKHYQKFFDENGLELMESSTFKNECPEDGRNAKTA